MEDPRTKVALVPDFAEAQTDPEDSHNFVIAWALLLGLVIYSAYQSLETWGRNLERQHHRAELLAAYRRRHDWKKSDIPRLQSLGINSVAQRRMDRLAGRGRPVVKPHQPLDVEIINKLNAFQLLTDPDAAPNMRRQAFKLWPWWSHYVEALYRGEHAIAKERGTKGASTEAENLVGRALGISAAKVHSICGQIRRKRKECADSANFPAMTLAEYESWIESESSLFEARLHQQTRVLVS